MLYDDAGVRQVSAQPPPPPTPPASPLALSRLLPSFVLVDHPHPFLERIASYKPNYTSISHNLDTRLHCRRNQSTTHPHRLGSGSSLTLYRNRDRCGASSFSSTSQLQYKLTSQGLEARGRGKQTHKTERECDPSLKRLTP